MNICYNSTVSIPRTILESQVLYQASNKIQFFFAIIKIDGITELQQGTANYCNFGSSLIHTPKPEHGRQRYLQLLKLLYYKIKVAYKELSGET